MRVFSLSELPRAVFGQIILLRCNHSVCDIRDLNRQQSELRVAVFVPTKDRVSETFIRAHIEKLPLCTVPIYGRGWQLFDARGEFWPILRYPGFIAERIIPRLNRVLYSRLLAWKLKSMKVEVVLAEYGPTGADIMGACQLLNVPLVVHFHGFDASNRQVLQQYIPRYRRMFSNAAAIVVVSTPMKAALVTLGADVSKIHHFTYGVDPNNFTGASPLSAPPHFVAVGRFVEKKAPCLTIRAFCEVVAALPTSRLFFVGDGPLLGPAKRLTEALGLQEHVEFLGSQDSEMVAKLMRQARAFVQHSITAENGDSEGAPVAVIEAQMTGLPVISTRHGGIPEIVEEGKTGYLVDEGDAAGMGEAMTRVALDSELAGRLGAEARKRALSLFTANKYLSDLSSILEKVAHRR